MSFADIQGQSRPIEIIRQYLSGSLGGRGLLFCGPQGVGKKLAALNMAKAINCLNNNLDPCEQCPSCLKINKGQHPDVSLIDCLTLIETEAGLAKNDSGDSNAVKIGHIRALQKQISLRPYEGKKKVFIIDEAQNMTSEASNALLKTLEQPPQDSLIILISSKPALLFKTIVSRCQPIKFSGMPKQELRQVLQKKYGLDYNCGHFLAFYCEGRLGYALKLKEDGLFFRKNEIIDGKFLVKERQDLRDILNILSVWYRDIYLYKAGLEEAELINYDRRQDLKRASAVHSFEHLDNVLSCISDSSLRIEQNINVKLLLANLKAVLSN